MTINGRAGKALAGMNARSGAMLNGQRSGKSLDQLREEPTPAAHHSLPVYGTVDMDAIYRIRRVRVSNRIRKGNKPIYGKAMKQYGVLLDPATVSKAKKLGRGLLARGLREAVRRAK